MVDDRITDGGRTAQLLASELSGRDDGPLARLSVVDADRDAEPSPEGTTAYGIAVDGRRVGDVRLYPDRAELRVTAASVSLDDDGRSTSLDDDGRSTSLDDDGRSTSLDVDTVVGAVRGPGLTGELGEDGTAVVTIAFGAAVKRAVDALVAGLD